jgi:hypothetical protein
LILKFTSDVHEINLHLRFNLDLNLIELCATQSRFLVLPSSLDGEVRVLMKHYIHIWFLCLVKHSHYRYKSSKPFRKPGLNPIYLWWRIILSDNIQRAMTECCLDIGAAHPPPPHMNLTSFERSSVVLGSFFFVPKVTS